MWIPGLLLSESGTFRLQIAPLNHPFQTFKIHSSNYRFCTLRLWTREEFTWISFYPLPHSSKPFHYLGQCSLTPSFHLDKRSISSLYFFLTSHTWDTFAIAIKNFFIFSREERPLLKSCVHLKLQNCFVFVCIIIALQNRLRSWLQSPCSWKCSISSFHNSVNLHISLHMT